MAKRKARKGSYKLTSKRRVALKKAQRISANKRRGHGFGNAKTYNTSGRKMNTAAMGGKRRTSSLGKNIAIGAVAATALTTSAVVARHKLSGSHLSYSHGPIAKVPITEVIAGRPLEFKNGYQVGGGGVTIRTVGTRDLGTAGLNRWKYEDGTQSASYTKRGTKMERILAYHHKPLNLGKIVGDRIRGTKGGNKFNTDNAIESTVSPFTPERIDFDIHTGKGTGETLNPYPIMNPDGTVKVPGMTKGNWGSSYTGKRVPGEGILMTYGGVEIETGKDAYEETGSASAPSRVQQTKQYRGQAKYSGRYNPSGPKVNGVPLDQYLDSLKGRYG